MAPAEPGDEAELADWLALARETAERAIAADSRSRGALYQAVGKAWDFALVAEQQPEAFAALLDDAGLAAQDRAPMTPVVKLVFGATYDKTRLAEYACVLGHAKDEGVGRGELGLARRSRRSQGSVQGHARGRKPAMMLASGPTKVESRVTRIRLELSRSLRPPNGRTDRACDARRAYRIVPMRRTSRRCRKACTQGCSDPSATESVHATDKPKIEII